MPVKSKASRSSLNAQSNDTGAQTHGTSREGDDNTFQGGGNSTLNAGTNPNPCTSIETKPQGSGWPSVQASLDSMLSILGLSRAFIPSGHTGDTAQAPPENASPQPVDKSASIPQVFLYESNEKGGTSRPIESEDRIHVKVGEKSVDIVVKCGGDAQKVTIELDGAMKKIEEGKKAFGVGPTMDGPRTNYRWAITFTAYPYHKGMSKNVTNWKEGVNPWVVRMWARLPYLSNDGDAAQVLEHQCDQIWDINLFRAVVLKGKDGDQDKLYIDPPLENKGHHHNFITVIPMMV
ncbi:hypothetical protein QFC21_004841 [Naganishia friedmannii]|uniref:Uncharacterized protein n=1 Tax=Naganishia friedmannii TaxID=89922 RepID=A0ACC2VF31_9TREE|nr:hypothetical protein QFC21_004841 [Naganishia friedmannii]